MMKHIPITRLSIAYCQLPIIFCLLPIAYCLLPIALTAQTYQQIIKAPEIRGPYDTGLRLNDVFSTADSGKIFTGSRQFSGSYGSAVLIKLDKSGTALWQKSYGGGPGQVLGTSGYKVLQTTDEGYLMVGLFADQKYSPINAAPYFVKTDKNGTIQWAKKIINKGFYDPSNPNLVYWDQFLDVQVTKDGGYICVGQTSMFGTKGEEPIGSFLLNRPTDVWLIKLDAGGTIKWTKTYGNKDLWEAGYAVRETPDGGYIIAGTAQIALQEPLTVTNDNQYGILLKTDDKGVLQWQKKYDMVTDRSEKNYYTGFYSLQITKDSSYILLGDFDNDISNTPYNGNSNKTALLKTDKNGNVTWFKVYTFPIANVQNGNSMHQTVDGGYVIGMDVGDNGHHSVLLKTDAFGIPSWAKTNGGTTILVDYDDGYYTLGAIPVLKIWEEWGLMLTKTDINGNIAGGCQGSMIVSVADYTLGVSPWISTTGAGGSFETTGSEQTFSITDTIGCFGNSVRAEFISYSRCIPDSVGFENSSTGTVFQWNFGDPASGSADSSTLANPKHKYSTEGTYTVTLTATDIYTGSSDTTTRTITLFDVTDKTIPYSGIYCTSDPNTIFDTTGFGLFYYSPKGLSMVDKVTGEIDFSRSTPGNYTLVYISFEHCPTPDTINITVAQAPRSKFSYKPIVYCTLDANPLAVLDAGSVAGVFSATPTGLVFKNALTGEVDAAASSPDTYIITNTVYDSINFPVCPSSTSIFYITLTTCNTCSLSVVTSKTDVSCDSINNGTASVTVTGGSGLYKYLWSTYPVQTTQTVTELLEDVYTVTVSDAAVFADTVELVANGDFSAGNTGFYSDYTYAPVNATAKGQYNVFSSPTTWNQIDYLLTNLVGYDRTTVNGNFMMVAGNATPNALVWCDTINVKPNTAYLFSAWLSSLHPIDTLSPAEVAITVNGASISNEYRAPATPGSWEQITASWYSGLNTSAVFCITNQNTSSDPGNWYGLDDISLVQFSGSITSCEQTDTVRIEFFQDNAVFIPTAFSPNNDGYNELECVFGSACVQSFRFAIFDRWGNNVFETDSPELCWDGTFKGKPMNSAVFVYYLSAVLTNGDAVNQKGNISLIR